MEYEDAWSWNIPNEPECYCGHVPYDHIEYDSEVEEINSYARSHKDKGKKLGHCWRCSLQDCEGYDLDPFSTDIDKIRIDKIRKDNLN